MKFFMFAVSSCSLVSLSAFHSSQVYHRRPDTVLHLENTDRRSFLREAALVAATSSIFTTAIVANAEDEDLTTKLFNEDGSLKDESIEIEAKFRKVELMWDGSNQLAIAVDGENTGSTSKGSSLRLSYELPEKWNTDSKKYIDKAEGVKVCERITIYRSEGTATPKVLEKASVKGIGESLKVTDDLKGIYKADLIGGRTRAKGDQKYYDFDMAVAPSSCSNSQEDLGLGFCPYDSIYLLSSTVFDNSLYVFALECDKAEWKLANSDLRRVRSSFSVERMAEAI
ncbi:hypothetical protein FisN_12Hh338 [Fistulifera solaris]|uniref:PsbP C-terminal domain-containing protein n=1 Tax=Fistulifera solaris TaxID=1519565 RepID=A0A1Z5KBU1_FISSO|nr:hypothetical protein FisN_12Hh338 [Fistulifera solaris]|eukprot:GAX23760.1 hypothetical protein FisN_12Hh338 [Fistulifera solaris]